MKSKECSKCHVEKPETVEFFRMRKRKDKEGLFFLACCKDCEKKYDEEYREKNKDAINERKRKSYHKDPSKHAMSSKKWRQNNPDKVRNRNVKWRKDNPNYGLQWLKDNPEKANASSKKWKKNNPDMVNEYSAKWRSDNPDKVRAMRRRAERKRRATDPAFRLRRNASNSAYKMLKSRGLDKQGKSMLDHVDWTPEQFAQHIENLWSHPDNLDENGNIWMNWDNHGVYNPNIKTWHVDHIKPHSDFYYLSPEDPTFKECWSLSNLRPLEAKQNILDGIKRTRHITNQE
jgi:hypothetical protein